MDYRDCIAIRKAYGIVRQREPRSVRLVFDELAILAKLELTGEALMTSQIAYWQKALRPTMTHRTNHLAALGLIKRVASTDDKRSVLCSITKAGSSELTRLSQELVKEIKNSGRLTRVSASRLIRYIEALGDVFLSSPDLVLLSLLTHDGVSSITQLVNDLGLLQPTVSMAVASLEDEGLVTRVKGSHASAMRSLVQISDLGSKRAQDLADEIKGLIIHRG